MGQTVKAPQAAAATSAAITVVLIFAITWAIAANASALNDAVLVPGLIKIVFVDNHGILFGLFAEKGPLGSNLLVAVTAALTVCLSVWAYRAHHSTVGLALGVIIGGALSNTVD
jgi:signal peptidase II